MAVKTRAQILIESNTTYIDNSVGSITPAGVRTLNDNWIDSIMFLPETGSYTVGTASLAITASYLSGTFDSASYANFATTASFAQNFNPLATASYALKAELAVTASHAVTGAFAQTAFLATTASNALTASYVLNAQSSSFANNAASAVSSSYALTASFLVGTIASASFATNANSANTASYVQNAQSASYVLNAVSASYAANVPATASYALQALSASNAVTASHALKIQNNISATFNEVTASNVQITGTASVAFLNVQFQSSSVIYSSGSNILGDASNDTQTLWGTVNVISGPLLVTGSANFQGGVTASVLGTASYANQALSSSFASTASFASNVASASYAISASYAQDANLAAVANTALSSNFASSSVSASYAATASFLSGVVTSASFAQTASFIANSTLRQNLRITGSVSLFDAAAPYSVQLIPDGTNVGLYVSGNLFVPSTFGITGSGAGITGVISSSYSVSSSYALSSSAASNAATASFVSLAQSASYVLNAVSASYSTTALSSSYASSALSSSYALTASFALNAGGGGFPYTGSAIISGSLIVTGSASGNVFSQSISSATSSLDFNTGNFFTSLVSGSTFFNVTNVKAGQTVNVLLTTAGALPATASFSSNVKQISGSVYTPTSGSSKTDILTFVSFDNSTAYLVATRNLV